MRLAVVGSREGADLDHLQQFLIALHRQAPSTTVVSGGATGADSYAEETWRRFGGRVVSYRPKRFPDCLGSPEYGIQRVELSEDGASVEDLVNSLTYADYVSACFFRNILIVDECDRLVAFMKKGGSRGAGFTAWWAEQKNKLGGRWEAK